MFKEKDTIPHFYDPFPKNICDAYIDIMKNIEDIPSRRDPYLYVQASLISLGFWPNENKEVTDKKLSLLNNASNLSSLEICNMFLNKPNIDNTKEIYIDSLKNMLDIEKNIFGDCIPANFKRLYKKITDGNLKDLTSWEKALLYKVKYKYAKSTVANMYDFLSSSKPISIADSLFEQLNINESQSQEFINEPLQLNSDVSFIDSFNPNKLTILTHALSESSLKKQIFLKSLGAFTTSSILSLSEGKIFDPNTQFSSGTHKTNWVLFFDPNDMLKSEIIILPNITKGAFRGENEVNILPPLDLSLCFSAVPHKYIKDLPGWEKEENMSKMIVIPKELLNKKDLSAVLTKIAV